MNTTTDLERRSTLTELCRAWQDTEQEIKTAFEAIARAEARLAAVFDGGSNAFSVQEHHGYIDWKNPAHCLERLQRQAWRAITNRLELRPLMSLAQIKELDAQIETGTGLPPIRYEDLLATVEALHSRRGEFLREKVHECYRWLRPDCWNANRKSYYEPYKTNAKSFAAGVGEKVIIVYGVERAYGRGYRVNYHKRDHLRALDQVFHLLDGKPQPTSYQGALADAIDQQTKQNDTNTAETDYFRAICYKNQNLHLEFKRKDLLDQFNAIAGGFNLNA